MLREHRVQVVAEVVHDLVVERMWKLQVRLPVFLGLGSQE